MKWKVFKVTVENGVAKEVVFLIEKNSFLGIRVNQKKILKKRIWGKTEIFGQKDFPWEEIVAEAKKRLGLMKDCRRKPLTPIVPEQEVLALEAKDLDEKITNKKRSKRYKGETNPNSTACDSIIKKNPRSLLTLNHLIPSQRLELLRLRAFGIEILEEGWVGLSRWRKSKEKPVKNWQKTKDIFSAIRMQDHIMQKYRQQPTGETPHLLSFGQIIEECNRLLIGWRSAQPQEKEDIRNKLIAAILDLENCKNEFKAAVKSQLEFIISWQDRTGRTNPGALAARTIASLDGLAQRLSEIEDIGVYIALRRELLVFIENWHAALIERMVGLIKQRRVTSAIKLARMAMVSPYWERAKQANFWLLNFTYKSCETRLAEKCLNNALNCLKITIGGNHG